MRGVGGLPELRVLIVEDEVELAGIVRRGMRERGLRADVATRGEDALWMAGATEYSAIVLDVMLPGIDGFETCRRLRALARRAPVERAAVLEAGELRLDPAARRVTRGGAEVELTPTEFALLEALMRRPGVALFLEREHGTIDGEPARLLAVPAGGDVLVVGAALDDQREALATLLVLGGLGLVGALLLGSAAGYWVAGLALRPVEAMRAEAEAITGTLGRCLPVPPVDDEIGRLGSTLNAPLERLETASAKERRFVADASHELRTPLAILKSEIDVALAAERGPEELRAALASAGEEADRLIRLAEDLLVLARAGEGELAIAPEPLAVRQLLDGVAARNRRRGEITVAAEHGLTVTADRERLLQAGRTCSTARCATAAAGSS
jgi:CheY-like chemotaxis protein